MIKKIIPYEMVIERIGTTNLYIIIKNYVKINTSHMNI